MSSLRTFRPRLVGAATLALAALLLTACGDDTGSDGKASASGATAPPNSPSTAAPATSPSTAASADSPSSRPSSSNAKPGPATTHGPADRPDSGNPVTCEGSNTKTVAAPLNRPVNHMLLTVTNTGGKTCFLYGYPGVRFGEAQAVPPVIQDSRPQAVVTLKPGESGYASVNLSAADGSGGSGHTEKSVAVYFQGPSGNESVGAGAHPALPAKGAYIDDSLKVTYWQQSMDNAVTW
ncbi:DUF4232 domain-containing protein [Embleya scabrispora]|uniref:DUF4232 domain-containing protein n=1 Tax=Embleya scabrispora TaxID=159449 RepID=UPI00036148BC|nr:DUF4232 domain-containing protein [Embleya scabrispora]MYS82152.1 DUF4232 domain-containing protein [Streptomyces sp. SID5474]